MTKNEFAENVSASERRGTDRKKLIIDVRYSDGDATAIANTRDIGIGGLYMTTNAKLEIGTPLSMTMTINTKEVSLSGVVVYTDPGHGVGIRFNNLSPEDESLLMSELNS
jgi:Tfp pilus assembly protein PilZ